MPPALGESGSREGPSERQQEGKRGCISSVEIDRKTRAGRLENPDFLFSQI